MKGFERDERWKVGYRPEEDKSDTVEELVRLEPSRNALFVHVIHVFAVLDMRKDRIRSRLIKVHLYL